MSKSQGASMTADILNQFSAALATRAAAAAPLLAAIKLSDDRHLSATRWGADLLVASEQALPTRDEFDVVLAGGAAATAKLVGRDAGTNIALLKLAQGPSFAAPVQ